MRLHNEWDRNELNLNKKIVHVLVYHTVVQAYKLYTDELKKSTKSEKNLPGLALLLPDKLLQLKYTNVRRVKLININSDKQIKINCAWLYYHRSYVKVQSFGEFSRRWQRKLMITRGENPSGCFRSRKWSILQPFLIAKKSALVQPSTLIDWIWTESKSILAQKRKLFSLQIKLKEKQCSATFSIQRIFWRLDRLKLLQKK